MQRAMALNMDPNGKAPVSLRDLELESSKEEMQLALHFRREEAERNNRGKQGPRNGREKEESGQPSSWTVGPTTRHVSGSITQTPPLPPPQNPILALPISSRTRNPIAPPPHLTGRHFSVLLVFALVYRPRGVSRLVPPLRYPPLQYRIVYTPWAPMSFKIPSL